MATADRATYDVIVIGAGPAGSTAAFDLAVCGLNVLILDKATFPREKTCGDGLTPRALRVLDDLGLRDRILREGASHTRVTFHSPHGRTLAASVPRRGTHQNVVHIIPRFTFDYLLLEHAIANGAHFEGAMRAIGMSQLADGVAVYAVHDSRQQVYRARMAIVAVGANIGLLRTMGILKRTPPVMLCTRAYYENISLPDEGVHCRFDSVPMPGYGWIFPLSHTRANVGAGVFHAGLATRWLPDSSRQVFDGFIQSPSLRALLDGAKLDGPIKGFPIRIDFARAPTYGPRTLLVGEAAGLANPITGEGIDYAMESARIASRHAAAMVQANDFSTSRLRAYDEELRHDFQRLFVLCDRLRLLYLNPLVLDRVISVASHDPLLADLYMTAFMENEDLTRSFSIKTLVRVAFG